MTAAIGTVTDKGHASIRWSFGLGASTALIAVVCIGLIRGREVSGKEED